MTESTDGGQYSGDPQEDSGTPGRRDEDGPEGQQTDRPVGTSDADDASSINPQEPGDGAPTLPPA